MSWVPLKTGGGTRSEKKHGAGSTVTMNKGMLISSEDA